MIVGLPLMKADDGTGVCGTCPERQLSGNRGKSPGDICILVIPKASEF